MHGTGKVRICFTKALKARHFLCRTLKPDSLSERLNFYHCNFSDT